jgi:DNA repair exonuclease SbcCD ATPase subunit
VRAYEATSATWEAARAKLSRAETLARSHEAYERQLTERKEKHDAACRALAVAADQVEVFVRAEREIGQATIGQVERIANRLLSSAGVDLTVSMTWGRETQNLETHCHRCGWEYPRGRGVKECEDCQATRAPKYEERLDLHPSERSDGAAEDLAGLAIQLAAAAWRRAEKGISFGVVVLDEVTASLDTANRKAIARVLSKMIREVGFSQAFVISHSNEVSESLPGRIEIVAGKNGSTARVIT